MKAASLKSRLGTRGRPEKSRAAILQAAVGEFSREGVAGARTGAIARSARVNKALLYYYFKDKEALYGAVLDQVFVGLTKAIEYALSQNLPPREKLLAYVGAHFDQGSEGARQRDGAGSSDAGYAADRQGCADGRQLVS